MAFSGRGDQIPGIGDGELPVVPSKTGDTTDTAVGERKDNDTNQDNSNQASSFQDNSYEVSGEDYMEVEDEHYKEGEMAKEGEVAVPDQSDTQTEEWQQTSHHDLHWDRPPHHQGEHASTAPPWDREKTSHESHWPPPRDRLSRWEGEQLPQERDGRPPVPREGERHDEVWNRREWRPPFDRFERGPRPPFPRDESDFGPLAPRPGRDRRLPLPPDEQDRRPPWLNQQGARSPVSKDDWDRKPPIPRVEPESGKQEDQAQKEPSNKVPVQKEERDRPPFLRGEQEKQPIPRDDQDRPPFPRDERDQPPFPRGVWDRPPFSRDEQDRPPFPRDEQNRPPFPRDEQDRPAFPRDEQDRPAFPRDEQDRPPFPRDEQNRPPFPRDEQNRPPFPRDEQDRPPFPRDEQDRPPFPRDGWDRPPIPKDEQERPPIPRDERDRPPIPRDARVQPPYPRDDRERPPFPRDERDHPRHPRDERDWPPFHRNERDWPHFSRDDWDRPPFPRDERDFPFPPRGGRDRWSPPPRDARGRWPPFPREEMDEFGWSREHGPPGRPFSPPLRGRRARPPFHEDERGRPISPPPWPPTEHYRRGRSPPGSDFRGRPPPPEKFDRFGHPLPPPPCEADFFDERGRPPPHDWDRRDWRRPPGEERLREPPYPDDQWRRSPPPYRDHPDHLPPDHPIERERDDRRGREDRFYEERPLDRRPPFDDYFRDRPPYSEDYPPRDPTSYPPHPEEGRHPSETPRVEKKPETVPVESILDSPGRDSRPDRIVIILRGPPGSGKTHVARLIKDKEVSYGAHAPRILALDDYFLMEVEKSEQDPDTGKKIKKKVTEYVYEEEMEEAYRASLFKSFTKTLEDGFFPVVIVDAIHDKVEHFDKYWSHAKQKGFEVYVAELMADAHACAKRNSHNRTFEDINKMVAAWEETPVHHLRLDVRSLLQDAVITEVEMEAADDTSVAAAATEAPAGQMETQEQLEEEESEIQVPSRSKWEDMEPAEDKLNKLDGIRPLKGKRRREESPPFPLSDDDDPYDEREEDMRIGKKRVRWADLEEKKELEHRRRIGFCIGTDWSLLTDPHAEIPRM
ncbi:YLP motif-containing protein 1-like isoform X2 [Orbicella faveolata]|uniref:YLP motif-containing protein 1-like isoform X2 n=1 Tax=Orbicella faveolata TaxID=48498 RepID=UPI0009E584A9|nr:YLP motif-containing protein 1-like isoform X2 [Orbicella faveolata]